MSIAVKFERIGDRNLRVIIAYYLPDCPSRRYLKTITFNQDKIKLEKNLIHPKQYELFVRWLVDKGAMSPALLHYNNTRYISKMIRDQIRMINNGSASNVRLQFKEFYDMCQKKEDWAEQGYGRIHEEDVGDRSVWEHRHSFFAPTNTGVSNLVMGASFTGKTHFLVTELNKLKMCDYDCVLLMTESKNAEPLKKLDEKLKVKIIEGYHPDKIEIFKKINDRCENKFRFLVILDDIVDQKESKTLGKLVLTYRNSNISTCVLIQYPFLINKSCRGNFHKIIVTGFKSMEDWKSASDVADLTSWGQEMIMKGDPGAKFVKKMDAWKFLKKMTKKPGVVIYIDQKHSKDPTFVDLS